MNLRIEKINQHLEDLEIPAFMKVGMIRNLHIQLNKSRLIYENTVAKLFRKKKQTDISSIEIEADEILIILGPSFMNQYRDDSYEHHDMWMDEDREYGWMHSREHPFYKKLRKKWYQAFLKKKKEEKKRKMEEEER